MDPANPDLWHVAFTDVDESGHWLRRVLAWLPHPRHVLLFRDTPAGLLVVQQTLGPLSVVVQPGCTALGFAAELAAKGGRTYVCRAAPEGGWLPKPITCVDIARSLLGLPYRPQTPAMFEREIRRIEKPVAVQTL